jgi:Ohr subfamily peroxiredoxin
MQTPQPDLRTVMPTARVLYPAKAHTTGGREGGASRTDDGHLDDQIAPPGSSAGTNPEQLFAAGWSTCFLSAIKIAAAKRKIQLPDGVAIDAEVDLAADHGEYFLKARLNVHLPGIDPDVGLTLVHAADEICPYSKATRGNIDVALNVV